MERESGYRPISCDFHDRLEESATLRRRVRLSLAPSEGDSVRNGGDGPGGETPSGETPSGETTLVGRIEDIYTTDTKEEFVRMDDGSSIRLDRILSVDEAP